MKFAIISNVEKLDDKFVTGPKTIRSIVSIQPKNKFIEDNINGEITRVELKSDLEITPTVHNTLLNYIETHTGQKMPINVKTADVGENLPDLPLINGFYLKQINEKYVLFKLEETTTSTGWFTTTTLTSTNSIKIGKYFVVQIATEHSVESEKITELKQIIDSIATEKNEILGECGSLESKVKHLNAENNFLKDRLIKLQERTHTDIIMAQYSLTESKIKHFNTEIKELNDRLFQLQVIERDQTEAEQLEENDILVQYGYAQSKIKRLTAKNKCLKNYLLELNEIDECCISEDETED